MTAHLPDLPKGDQQSTPTGPVTDSVDASIFYAGRPFSTTIALHVGVIPPQHMQMPWVCFG